MKKIALTALALALAASFAPAQSLSDFKSAFESFAGDMASSLALDASIGSNWSDAYVGGFPRFGVGFATGAAATGKGSAGPIFAALGQAVPSGLDGIGVPIPAAALTFKIGLPFLPADIGLTGGYIPPSVGSKLEGLTGVAIDYMNIGAQLRFALLKENLVLPDLSVGIGASYQQGGVEAPMGVGAQTLADQTIAGHAWRVTASDPRIALGWESTIVDATLQVSKNLLFVRPYLGAGCSFGKSGVTGGVSSQLGFSRDGSASTSAQLAADLASAGLEAPEFDAEGYSYSVAATDPVLRVYGGVSLSILLLVLDAQAVYVPKTEALGASLTTRIQL